jgi:hypothetical protein
MNALVRKEGRERAWLQKDRSEVGMYTSLKSKGEEAISPICSRLPKMLPDHGCSDASCTMAAQG